MTAASIPAPPSFPELLQRPLSVVLEVYKQSVAIRRERGPAGLDLGDLEQDAPNRVRAVIESSVLHDRLQAAQGCFAENRGSSR